MFLSEQITTIDAKGRTSIPSKYREFIAENYGDDRFYLTKSLMDLGGEIGRGLVLYPHKEFFAYVESLPKMGYSYNQLSAIHRLVVNPAEPCTADKQGRILIPPAFRTYAGLERTLVVAGVQNKIEIWSQENWDRVIAQSEKDYLSAVSSQTALGVK